MCSGCTGIDTEIRREDRRDKRDEQNRCQGLKDKRVLRVIA
jgi:hypothetical protein